MIIILINSTITATTIVVLSSRATRYFSCSPSCSVFYERNDSGACIAHVVSETVLTTRLWLTCPLPAPYGALQVALRAISRGEHLTISYGPCKYVTKHIETTIPCPSSAQKHLSFTSDELSQRSCHPLHVRRRMLKDGFGFICG
jgi:hypothetical protein